MKLRGRNLQAEAKYCISFWLTVAVSATTVFCSSGNSDDLAASLKLGGSVDHTIAGGQKHSYGIALRSGEYLHVAVEQRGANVFLALSSPKGRLLHRVDRWQDISGLETISWIAESSGQYRREIGASENDSRPGKYRILNVTIQPSSGRKYTERVDAESAWAKSDELYDQATPDAKQGALEQCEKSLSLWRAVGDLLWQATVLDSLGVQYYEMGEGIKAVRCYQEAVSLAHEIKDAGLEGTALSNSNGTCGCS